jgi:SprB repeat
LGIPTNFIHRRIGTLRKLLRYKATIQPILNNSTIIINSLNKMKKINKVKSSILGAAFLMLTAGANSFAQDCTGFRTYTIGGWGANCNGNNAGCYRDAHFASAFPNGLTIGCGTGSLTLTSAQDVNDFLPCSGPSSVLPAGNMLNPGGALNNTLAGQIVAVTLAVGFDAADANYASNAQSIGGLQIASGTFSGMSVTQFLAIANDAIGGCATGYSLADLNSAATAINQNYDNGISDDGFLMCNQVPPMIISLLDPAHVNCNGDYTAELTASVTGGTAPYSYLWSNGGTTATISNLPAGTYSVVVTDANGISAGGSAATIVVPQPDPILLAVEAGMITCHGGTTSISVYAEGGVGSFSGLGIFDNMPAGTYTYTVADGNGCEASASVVVTEPELLVGSASAVNVTCFGANNGSVTFSAQGGTEPYFFTPSSSMSNLTSGTYSATISDAYGCETSASASVSEPMPLAIATSSTNAVCYGGRGTATVTVTGGTPAYSYSWDGGAATTSATANLLVGNHSVVITDANGCAINGAASIQLNSCTGFTTVTMGGYGASCSGGNWGCYVVNNFTTAFPNGVQIGSNGRFVKLTSAKAVDTYLPASGASGVLAVGTATNPASPKNTLAGQAMALTLSIGFDNAKPSFSTSTSSLSGLILSSGACAGMSVAQVLAEANKVLGGMASNYSASTMTSVLDVINRNYDNGTVNLGALACACPSNARVAANDEEVSAEETQEVLNVNNSTFLKSYPNPFSSNTTIVLDENGFG